MRSILARNKYISINSFPLLNFFAVIQSRIQSLSTYAMYMICVLCFGSCLVENKKENIDPHKFMLINDVAMVTYIFNKLLHLLLNMNTLVQSCQGQSTVKSVINCSGRGDRNISLNIALVPK